MSEKNNQAVSEILALINQIREQKLSADYVTSFDYSGY